MSHAIHHVNIHTPDLDRLWKFYREAFGFELVFEHELEELMAAVDNYLDFRLSPECTIR